MTSVDRPPVVTVLIDRARPPGMAAIERAAEVRYVTAAELEQGLRGADVLLLWDFFSGALRDSWLGADALRWVHIVAAGVDTLLFPELVESGVVVTNARGVFDRPIAEYVLGAILAFAKRMPESLRLQQAHTWRHRETERVDGARAVVVGTGGIGREIARLLRAAGLQVSGVGRVARADDPDFGTVTASAELAEIVSEIDYLVLAAPLTDQTRHVVDGRVLANMASRARLVNVGRGELVDTDALVEALRGDSIAGAALDVFETEPLPADSPLWGMENVLVSAHMSGDASGWHDRLVAGFATNFERYAAGKELRNIVDKRRGYVPG